MPYVYSGYSTVSRPPLGSTVISPMGVNGLVPFEGISVSDSRVKADTNCLLQILALSRHENGLFMEGVVAGRKRTY